MRKQYAWIVLITGTLMALPPTAFAQESRRWNPDRREDRRDRHEDVRDRREDRRDRLEDRRDARHEGGRRDRLEDVRDRREDRRDVLEDHRGLVERTIALVEPGGVVYFSTNHQRFEPQLHELQGAKEAAEETIRKDR